VWGLWRWLASRFDAKRLVFVDESGFHTSITFEEVVQAQQ
jgi:hypothetical protein